jgi:fluoride ion exporter CrcB/FEX
VLGFFWLRWAAASDPQAVFSWWLVCQPIWSCVPYGTFVINVTGSFIIGFFLAFAQERVSLTPLLAPFLRRRLSRWLHNLFDF